MVTQATNRTATIEGRNIEDDFDYGPTDQMAADSILVTTEKLISVGGAISSCTTPLPG
jgi:hypothetical protein